MSKEVIRKAIVDWDWNNILASVVQSTSDPTKYGIVICNPDWSPISPWGWVKTIVAWEGITVDNTDPKNPVISSVLSSNLVLYSTNTASDISGYSRIVTDIEDPDYDEPAVNIPIWPITWTDQLVWELATDAWILVGNPWTITITTIWEIRRTWGSGTAEFYFKVFHRNSGGTETEIAVSNNTMPLSNTIYAQFNASALLNNWTFIATDRIVVKYYATKVWGGSDPSYDFLFGGSNPIRTLLPVPSNVILNNYYTKDETDDLLDGKRWLTGNAGTNPSTNFIGTTDNQPLAVRTNNVERIRVLSTGNVDFTGVIRADIDNIPIALGSIPGTRRMQGYSTGTSIRFFDTGDNFADVGFESLSLGNSYGSTLAPNNGAIIEGSVGIGTNTPASKLAVTWWDIEVTDIGSWVILKSPNWTRWRITVWDNWALTTTSL